MADFATDPFIDAIEEKAEKLIKDVVEPITGPLMAIPEEALTDADNDKAVLETAQNAAAVVWAGVVCLLDPPPSVPQAVVVAAMMMARQSVMEPMNVATLHMDIPVRGPVGEA
jgi:hypothetical protein